LGDEQCPAGSALLVTAGDQQGERLQIPAVTGPLVIGRADDCDLVLRDADASRHHAEVRRAGAEVEARDLGSKNGLRVNGAPRRGPVILREGDLLELGQTALRLEPGSAPRTPGDSESPGGASALPPPRPGPPPEPRAAAEHEPPRGRRAGAPGELGALAVFAGLLVILALIGLVYIFR